MPRTVYVAVSLQNETGVGVALWDDDQDNLPTWDERDERYVVTVPDGVEGDEITDALDAFLGEYDLPEGWESGPIQ